MSNEENGRCEIVARDSGEGWVSAILKALAEAKPGDTVVTPPDAAKLAERIRDAKGYSPQITIRGDRTWYLRA